VRTEAEQIFRRYGRDHKLSFSDAVSFVVVTTLEARNNSKRNPFGLEFWNLAFRKFEIVSDFVIRISNLAKRLCVLASWRDNKVSEVSA
jgi:hypothetical protein